MTNIEGNPNLAVSRAIDKNTKQKNPTATFCCTDYWFTGWLIDMHTIN